jgi:hypothetical protein
VGSANLFVGLFPRSLVDEFGAHPALESYLEYLHVNARFGIGTDGSDRCPRGESLAAAGSGAVWLVLRLGVLQSRRRKQCPWRTRASILKDPRINAELAMVRIPSAVGWGCDNRFDRGTAILPPVEKCHGQFGETTLPTHCLATRDREPLIRFADEYSLRSLASRRTYVGEVPIQIRFCGGCRLDLLLNIDGPPTAIRPQMRVSPVAVCPEYARLLKKVRDALTAHKVAVENLLQVTGIGDHASFVEARKAVYRALAEVQTRCNALKEHLQEHEYYSPA